MALKFFMNPQSRSRMVRWALEEIGCPYDAQLVNYGPEMKGEAYLAVNPMGKVPAIDHDGKIVTEAAAIVTYLADAFPEAKLAPAPADRAAYYRWLFFAAGPVEQAVTNNYLGITPEKSQEAMMGYGNFEQTAKVLANHLGSTTYVTGDTFTAADIYIGMSIAYGLQFNTLPKLPEFIAYVNRIKERPAFIKANKLDDELVPKQG